MESVPIHTTFEETYRQLLFIDSVVVSARRKRNLRRAVLFLVLTLVSLLLFFFSESDFGAAGVFALPFWWVCFGFYLLYLKWKTHKRRTGVLKQLAKNSLPESPSEMHLSFSTERVSVARGQETTTVKWSDFRAYLEEEDTVYLLQEHPYLAWSFSAKEIGAPALAELREIAKLKLPAFKM
ncbi:hypothetical protein [Pontibacter kalidii]|uniref:hypothetical protein n=1 Tax=Pontibacter kalidii TaxID=2592049 RepID=UPI00224CD2B7|nr:hypothetical protein [Pontibacter kalidii]